MAPGLLMAAEREGGYSLGLEETELRLGPPGGDGEPAKNPGKRGFSETLDLKLKLPTVEAKVDGGGAAEAAEKARKAAAQKSILVSQAADPEKPPAPKAQVVGWPPVRSFRKNILSVQSAKGSGSSGKEDAEKPGGAAYVKVSMDGAPYLRKVDLRMYRSYQELSMALEKMFSSFTSAAGNCDSQLRDFMNENKLVDLLNGSEYVPTYEDKDGDWMLVGDVPWEMFVDSCKRLRIMKGSEAIGLG
ncbi:hypothetical protein Taro_045070 [Colocasia esculenta]|uniref:Auxin-responsive protein n=1 Tax=Colocasia esculenta TaxID=4460 RepID=A0A843X3N8_COLES|nr:hypothetical protein [Colocasia esculenta]